MKLSKRLKTISEFIDGSEKIIDIGCDHALLDIYLCENFKDIKIIASDIHEGAINGAKKNIEKYNMESNIDLRMGDGLSVVNDNEIDTIIISGMGYNNIIKILSDSEKLKNVSKIIIQSNTDVVKLRKSVIKLGYKISREKLVQDNDIVYTIIEFVLGKEKYSYEEIYFGPYLLQNKDELFYEYYNKKLLKYENLLLQLPSTNIVSRIHHMNLIKIIKKELDDKKVS